jgi:hypothetical protein
MLLPGHCVFGTSTKPARLAARRSSVSKQAKWLQRGSSSRTARALASCTASYARSAWRAASRAPAIEQTRLRGSWELDFAGVRCSRYKPRSPGTTIGTTSWHLPAPHCLLDHPKIWVTRCAINLIAGQQTQPTRLATSDRLDPIPLNLKRHSDSSDRSAEGFASIGFTDWGISLI